MSPSPWSTILKVIAIIGALSLLGLLGLRAWVFVETWRNVTPASYRLNVERPVRGGEGSACGGELRLPCGPGTRCMGSTAVQMGTCRAVPYSLMGEACSLQNRHCEAGFYCRSQSAGGGCAKLTAEAPFIISLKPDGMEPAENGYRWNAEASGRIQVKASNVQKVLVRVMGSGGFISGPEQELTLLPSGYFEGVLKIPASATTIRATAIAANGSFASMDVALSSQ